MAADPAATKAVTFLSVVFIGAFVAYMATRLTPQETFSPDLNAGRTPEAAARKLDPEMFTYKVQRGDTWAKIAKAHGATTRALLDRNDAAIDTKLAPGQNILLPETAPRDGGIQVFAPR